MVHGGGRGHVINLDYASPLLLLRPKKKKKRARTCNRTKRGPRRDNKVLSDCLVWLVDMTGNPKIERYHHNGECRVKKHAGHRREKKEEEEEERKKGGGT